MKKTININLGGQPFIINEQAYDMLHHYFEALRQKFTNENEQKEILSDIESRVAEVFGERLDKNRAVVDEEDVVYIITLLGRPEDIAGESEAPAEQEAKTTISSNSTNNTQAEKKLFRDPDNKKIGGVISGLCHYFGWADPTWIRVATVIIFVLSIYLNLHLGIPITIIYFILLIVVPEASTSAEKLQMRGVPVTIQNIEKQVRDAMTTAGRSVDTLIKEKKITNSASKIILGLLTAFAKIALVFVLIICVALMLALTGVFFGFSMLSSASLTEVTQLVVSSRYIIMLFNLGILLTFGIPLVAIMYISIKFLTNRKAKNPVVRWVLACGWFIGIILLSISSWTVFKSFAGADTNIQRVKLLSPQGGTLTVQLADTMGNMIAIKNKDDEEFSSFVNINGLTRSEYGYAYSNVKLEIAVSPDSNFYVEKVAFSRGVTSTDASKNIQQIHYKFSQTDSILNLDNKLELPKTAKWRDQKIKIRIFIPEGKRITFGNNINRISTSIKGNEYYEDGMFPGKTLQIENGKVKCLNCKEKIITDDSSAMDVDISDEGSSIDSIGHMTIHTVNGKEDLKNVSVNINPNGISVSGQNKKNEDVKVNIDSHGVKALITDTNGNTKIISK